ncbi:MAG: hypothetical protein QNJ00_02555 [Woeseiaceae bacterium]|nr:hypothetical protein [Woeseiaceae bacterium]
MLPAYVVEEIAAVVRGGFHDRFEVAYLFREGRYEPGELDPDEVNTAVEAAFAAWEQEKQDWPEVTDCDRLDTAFAALNKRGIIALQNAGYTQSDGYEDVGEAYANHANRSSVLGYCFYHGQDLERAVGGGGLYLAFGPVDPEDEETKGPEVGNIIKEELQRVGFAVDWDGTFAKRIAVPALNWQRR